MVPCPSQTGKIIKKGAPNSHVTALRLWRSNESGELQQEGATAWQAAQRNADQALSARALTSRIILEQLYYLAVGHTAISKLPGLLEHIQRTASIIEAQCSGTPNVSANIPANIPVERESWKFSGKVSRGLHALAKEVLRVSLPALLTSPY